MENKIIPGMEKLIAAEKAARENARPEPIISSPDDLKPRTILPTQAEIVVLKKEQGIKYLGQ